MGYYIFINMSFLIFLLRNVKKMENNKLNFRQKIDNIPSFLKNRYAFTIFLFIVWILFFDSNTIWSQFKLQRQLNEKINEKAFYETEIKDIKESLYELETNNITQEKFAREKYFMKRANEDVFVVSEEE